jgi:hypothetical protein
MMGGAAKERPSVSRHVALDNIRLAPCSRWARTEYSVEYHEGYARSLTGLEQSTREGRRAFYDALGLDFLWSTDDGLAGDWLARGRATDMGHAAYASGGADRRDPVPSPFRSVDEVWAFDPDAEYGLPAFEDQVAAYARLDAAARRDFPGQLVTGGTYKTIVSGAIQAFGWDLLLEAAADRRKFEAVLDRFFRRTLFHMRAWARTPVEAVIQHDDFVWAGGPFLEPEFFRRAVIARYAELWRPLHEAGKKVLFCSDGTFMDLAEDIVRAGADGLVFEPCNDFTAMADRFGGSVCLVGSHVDCRDLTLGRWDAVERAVKRTFRDLGRCRGAIVAVGNHLPGNIGDEMLERYLALARGRNAR